MPASKTNKEEAANDMMDKEPLLAGGEDSVLSIEEPSSAARTKPGRRHSSGHGEYFNSMLFRNSSNKAQTHQDSDVAFRITVSRETADAATGETPKASEAMSKTAIDMDMQETLQEAVAGAVTDVVQEVMHDTVHEAVQQAIDNHLSFDLRANVYTLVAITGVILYWRGIWTLWDYCFKFSIWSEVGAIVAGLVIIAAVRVAGVPLAEGWPT